MQGAQEQAIQEVGPRDMTQSRDLHAKWRAEVARQKQETAAKDSATAAVREAPATQAREEAERQRLEDEAHRDQGRDGGRGW